MAKPVYEIRFTYTRRGRGVGIALYQYKPFSLFRETSQLATMAFMQESGRLLTADGEPMSGVDGGYFAEDWHSVKELMYEDSPDDGTIEDMLNSEYPGLLSQVMDVLREGRSQRLTPHGKVIKIPKRTARDSDGAYVAKLVRAYNGLPLRGTDEVGHVVNVHKEGDNGSVRDALYRWTINYETRSWAWDFQEWYDELAETSMNRELPEIDVLSSYEIALLS